MKHKLISVSIIFLFFIMLLFPKQVFAGSCNGLLLWFNIILPTLLPFMIISNLLLHTSAINLLVRITSPILCRIFRVSDYGSFAVLCGFLCGFPMGSKVTADLLNTDRISLQEAKYLLSFCNNTSPMFIISYVFLQNLNDSSHVIPSLIILLLSSLLCSCLFRFIYRFHIADTDVSNTSKSFHSGNLLDKCILSSFEAITKIGGYIILFSVIIQMINIFPFTNNVYKLVFLPFLEITNGVSMISQSTISFSDKYILILSLISFGGCCSIAQTKCMISNTNISIFPYIIEKLIATLATSLLAICYLKLF